MKQDVLHAVQFLAEHLVQGSAVLFTGAGINFGLENADGIPFPLGQSLADAIVRDLVDERGSNIDLQDAADMARRKVTSAGLNQYIANLFSTFAPGAAHSAAVRLPWNAIYTTNYDLLLEQSAVKAQVKLHVIYSPATDLSRLEDGAVPYYKIHGCIDHANTEDGHLTLTPEDYRASESKRTTLFSRLRRDLLSKAFVFVGYGLKDTNLRQILDEVRHSLGSESLPPSFAIRRDFSAAEQAYWKDKYNVQLISCDASEFLLALHDTFDALPSVGLKPRPLAPIPAIDADFAFQVVGGCFQLLAPEACVGSSDPLTFFRGGTYRWTDARDRIAPLRDDSWSLFEYVLNDITDPSSSPTCYLVTGAAGTGKTTLCRSVAYGSAHEFKARVFIHIPGTPLDPAALGVAINAEKVERIFVFTRDAASILGEVDTFMSECRRLHWPVSLILEERRNEWLAATSRGKHVSPLEIQLGSISPGEIELILDSLSAFDCLGKLKGLDRHHQREHFASVASKDLLVALRELTSEGSFDEIVRDEYESIPSEIAKRAYVFVAAVGQANVPLRYEHLIRLTGVPHSALASEILRPTDQVLIDGEYVGDSHASKGYTLRTRHPIIASIIFSLAAPDDRAKFEIFRGLVALLDPGYPEDRRLLEHFVRKQEIIQTLSDPNRCREIFDLIGAKLPGQAFVQQQRSVLERHLGDAARAVEYARQAVRLDPTNLGIKNTLGFAFEYSARTAGDAFKRKAFLSQARKAFEDGRDRDPTSPYNYIGLAQVMRGEAEGLSTSERALAQAGVLAFLEDAFEKTSQSEIVAKALAEEQKKAGDPNEALRLVSEALDSKPSDTYLRVLQVKLLRLLGENKRALDSCLSGLREDPNSWQLNHAVARLLRETGGTAAAVRGHYDAACRHKVRDMDLLVEYAAYLFEIGAMTKAAETFDLASRLSKDASAIRKIRASWKEPGTNRDAIFEGRVTQRAGAMLTLIAVPKNFEVKAWQTDGQLKIGDVVQFTVAFDAAGARGRIHNSAQSTRAPAYC
jgi:tetratricopeptide (TPR) repeat protein